MSMSARRIVVVGGYGHVGRLVCRRILDRGLGQVIVAGRNKAAAESVAHTLANGAMTAFIDARTGDGAAELLDAGSVVVNCSIDQRDPALLRAAIAAGCGYADIGADPAAISAMLDLQPLAWASGTRALVGVGLSPGATNVLARAACQCIGSPALLDVSLILSMRDAFGRAAVEWLLEASSSPNAVERHGRRALVSAFDGSQIVKFPGIGTRPVYRFPLPEQFFFPETLGVKEANCWIGIDPPIVGRVLSRAVRSPARRLLRGARTRSRLAGMIASFGTAGLSDTVRAPLAVVVTAGGPHGTALATLAAMGESSTTATCAVLMIDRLVSGATPAGVVLPEEAIDPGWFFDELRCHGIDATVRPPV